MSQIGNTPITISDDVTLELKGNTVMVKGPKGELAHTFRPEVKIEIKDNLVSITRKNESKFSKSLHGLTRSLIANMITGVTQGYEKTLELVGTGYRVKKDGNGLTITVGFSHPVLIKPISGIKFDIKGENKIIISGIDKQLVGQIAADIRQIKKPEPYKGKGIRYENEVVRRKPGKAAKVAAA